MRTETRIVLFYVGGKLVTLVKLRMRMTIFTENDSHRSVPKKFVVQGNVIGLEVISVKNLRRYKIKI